MTELVRAGRDDDLAELIDRARTAAEGLRLRRAAEAAAATVRLGRGGSNAWAPLFIVSMVIGFDDEMPATQVEPLLRSIVQSGWFRDQLEVALRRRFREALLLDDLFTLEGLDRLRLSAVRQASEAMAAGHLAAARRALGARDEHPVRRSGAFARFLVGQRRTGSSPPPLGELRLQRTRMRLDAEIGARLCALRDIDVRLNVDFFEGLFSAMTRYQDVRLRQICHRTAQRLGAGEPVGACLLGFCTRSSSGVDLLLTNAKTQSEVSRHRIVGRPGVPIDATMRRIESALRRSGVDRIESVAHDSGSRSPARADSASRRKSLFAISI